MLVDTSISLPTVKLTIQLGRVNSSDKWLYRQFTVVLWQLVLFG
jgi:hypothetical protein